jgi:hypothetical protein
MNVTSDALRHHPIWETQVPKSQGLASLLTAVADLVILTALNPSAALRYKRTDLPAGEIERAEAI